MKSTLEKMMAAFDDFDDITCEEDSGYLAYQAELEYREWYENGGWMEEVNAELRELAESEFETKVSECLLTYDDFGSIRRFGD
jgi:hypothetical protein